MMGAMRSARIRTATPADASAIAEMILLSAEHFLPAVFGPHARDALAALAARSGTLFSCTHVRMADLAGRAVGMLLGYSGTEKAREDPATGYALFRFLGISLVRALPRLLRVQRAIGGIGAEEWYVSNVAVLPRMRGHGVGHALLLDAEERARERSAAAIVLDVETDHPAAEKLYASLGYRILRTTRPLTLEGHAFAFRRMSKPLHPDATVGSS